MPNEKKCKDCDADSKRPAPYPGPRCATHHRAFRRSQKDRAHDRKVQSTFGLAEGQYALLLAHQVGRCAICRRATGAAKRLAVDHDHATGLVRGLLCGPCNQLLGHGRDDLEFFWRIIRYLIEPPATQLGIKAQYREEGKNNALIEAERTTPDPGQ